jgi:hypothetical protein
MKSSQRALSIHPNTLITDYTFKEEKRARNSTHKD